MISIYDCQINYTVLKYDFYKVFIFLESMIGLLLSKIRFTKLDFYPDPS